MTSPAGNDHVQGGFTFIELVFVALILGLLLASVLPRVQQSWAGLQAERTAFELAQSLRTARTLAVAQGRPVEWHWDAEARRVSLKTAGADGTSESVTGRLGRPRTIPDQVTLTVLQDEQGVAHVNFFPDGTSEPTTLLISDATSPRHQITVDETTSQVVVQPPPPPR